MRSPVPAPLERWRDTATAEPVHAPRTAAVLGIALGVTFTICFATGLYSEALQNNVAWIPSRPAGLYRVTQSLHVATGIATVPLLLAKLWSVYPHFFAWPPVTSVATAIERISLVPLVSGSVFLLVSGIANISRWYPWTFFFPTAHYWAAWITIGALVVHVGAKASITRLALSRDAPPEARGEEPARDDDLPRPLTRRPSRRQFLGLVAATSGALTAVTVGQTVGPLQRLTVLAPRRPGVGPQGFPVNRAAAEAPGVLDAIDAIDTYRLEVVGRVDTPLVLTLDEIESLATHRAKLAIQCVEGWSASVRWRGVPVRLLLDMAGAPHDAEVLVRSLQQRRSFRTSLLTPNHARDRDTLLAVEANGETLVPDHGYPLRLVAPNRPGVMQTKWVHELEVL